MPAIPLKDIIYASIIAILLALFGGYTLHERHVGAQKVVAKVTAVGNAAKAKTQRAESTAQTKETENAKAFHYDISMPPVRNLGIVCVNPGRGQVSAADASGVPRADQSAPDRREGPAYDPSGALLERAHQADAQIKYLQRRVKQLEQEMNNAP